MYSVMDPHTANCNPCPPPPHQELPQTGNISHSQPAASGDMWNTAPPMYPPMYVNPIVSTRKDNSFSNVSRYSIGSSIVRALDEITADSEVTSGGKQRRCQV